MQWGLSSRLKTDSVPAKLSAYRLFRKERLSQRLTEAGIGFEDVLFFTDSRNDLPLAERAGYTVCVNPDAVLESAARKNGWKVAEWKLSLRTQMTAQVDAKGVPETQTVRS